MKLALWLCVGVVSLCVLALPSQAFAGIENRPLNTDEATVLDAGVWVVATGLSAVRQPNNDWEWTWATDLEYGLLEGVEVDVELPYLILDRSDEREQRDVDGFGDLAVQVEWNPVAEATLRPALSLAGSFKTHSANEDRGLGSGEVDYTLTLLGSKGWGRTSLHVNAGMTVVGDPPGTDLSDSVNYNLAVEHEATERLMWAVEVYGQTNTDREAETHPWEVLAGVVYQSADHLAFDVGLGMGLSQASPDLRLVSGVTLTF